MRTFIRIAVIMTALVTGLAFAQENKVPQTQEEAAMQETADTGVTIETQPALVAGNVTVNFKNADIKAVLNYLADVGGVDIVPAPDVAGQISMKLTNKPWQVALDILVRNCGYVIVKEGDVIRVVKKESLEGEEQVTEVISLNYMVPSRYLSGIAASEGATSAPGLNSDADRKIELPELIAALKAVLKTGETVTFLPTTNSLIVTAIPARISTIKALIQQIDVAPEQIMLEAKIIEIKLDKNEKMGIDWTAQITMTGAKRPTTMPFEETGNIRSLGAQLSNYFPKGANYTSAPNFPTSSNDGTTGFPFSDIMGTTMNSNFSYGTLDFSQFSAVMQYINKRENAKILATPRITTLNNNEAYIRVTDNVYLEKLTSSTTTENYVVGTEFEKEPRESGIILQVIPHVNEHDDISVTIKPTVGGPITFETIDITSGNDRVVMRASSRTAETQVMVKDNETVFIGGLIDETTTVQDHRVPVLGDLLGDLPGIGTLVKYKSDVVSRTEIVIFITVHLMKNTAQVNMDGLSGISDPGQLNNEPKAEEGLVLDQFKTVAGAKEVSKEHKPLFDFRKKKKT